MKNGFDRNVSLFVVIQKVAFPEVSGVLFIFHHVESVEPGAGKLEFEQGKKKH